MATSSIRASHATLAGRAPGSPGTLAGSLGRVSDLLLIWHERAAQRRRLRSLDNRMLRDIGLSRADAEGEGSKPFWRS